VSIGISSPDGNGRKCSSCALHYYCEVVNWTAGGMLLIGDLVLLEDMWEREMGRISPPSLESNGAI
jgi:hypothetical protein